MKKGEYTKAIAKLSRIRKNRLLKPVFSTIDGPQKAVDLMADYLIQTLSGTNYPRNGRIPIPHCLSTCQSSQACFDLTDCPFDLDEIKSVILNLPRKKAPGIDHITSEIILPLLDIVSPILLYLFQLCWQWSYTPQLWRISQTVPNP
ncbi:hypothetical protein RMCBS344292_13070 [Rhizopus microsporus]|nr:hypothetical protein RMCBS344292_13070 [Rhizopus microsporus]